MENRLNKKVEEYVSLFKQDIKQYISTMSIKGPELDKLIEYIYDYERLYLIKDDFQKRKRVKNVVPIYDRCCAKRATNEQCTRRRKEDSEYCGTHVKGTPHGCIDSPSEQPSTSKKVQVWAQDIGGIMYYIDDANNVYSHEDVITDRVNPKIIAKYVKHGDAYSIPEYNI